MKETVFSKFKNDTIITLCEPYGNGHINDTYLVECKENNENTSRYILQRINTNVFKQPEQVMHNIEKVTSYLKENTYDTRRVLTLVPTLNQTSYYKDEEGNYWRLYHFVEDSICLDLPETTEDFYQSALAFGDFQRQLNGFDVSQLYETIKDFHNTPDRFQKFLNAVSKDVCHRAKDVEEEINFFISRQDFYGVLIENNKNGSLPLRVTHNDTKINNVMLNKSDRKALCVIDLDTIMPGFSVNDFGDSIRFGASTAAEDETNLDKVWMDLELFETYAKGFIEGCGGLLNPSEILLMPEGAKMMTIECGMRFLTDYLEGDTYFKTRYPNHNLDRCHTQMKLVSDMENKWEQMKNIVKKYM